jgi:hypothetical protein
LASALKLLGVPNTETGIALLAAALVAPPLWMLIRRRHGFSMLVSRSHDNGPTESPKQEVAVDER